MEATESHSQRDLVEKEGGKQDEDLYFDHEDLDWTPPPRFVMEWCRLLVNRPWIVMAITMFIPLLLSIVAFGAFSFEIDTSGDSFTVRTDEIQQREDVFLVGKSNTVYNITAIQTEGGNSERERVEGAFVLTLTFEATGDNGNVFSVKNLEFIHNLQQDIINYRKYNEYCKLDYFPDEEPSCSLPVSLINWFFAEEQQDGNDTVIVPNGNNPNLWRSPEDTLRYLYETNRSALIDNFVDKEFSPTNLRSTVTRITFLFGLPYEGFNSKDDRLEEQESIFEDWVLDLGDVLRSARSKGSKQDLRVLWIGSVLTESEFDSLILRDGSLAFAAVVFVFVYVWFHTTSFYLTMLGMLHVIISYPTAYFVYRVLMGVKMFNMLLTLSIFIILGIGADDIFIMLDAWKQSKHYSAKVSSSFEARMAFSWVRATKAMGITSVTTAVAFLANGVSIIPPIRTFGIFTGVMVIINYLLVITWYPAVVVTWSRHFEGKFQCFSALYQKMRKRGSKVEAFKSDTELEESQQSKNFETEKNSEEPKQDSVNEEQDDQEEKENNTESNLQEEKSVEVNRKEDVEKGNSKSDKSNHIGYNIQNMRFIERFFYQYYAVYVYKARYFVAAAFVILAIISIVGASQLSASSEPSRFLPNDHPVQRAIDLEENRFKQSERVVQVILAWGIKRLDRSNADVNDPEKVGDPDWDENFDLSQPESQTFFLETCEKVKEVSSTKDDEVYCFMRDFIDFYGRNYTGSEFLPKLVNFTSEFEYTQGNVLTLFGSDFEGQTTTVRFQDPTGELRFVSIIVNTTINRRSTASTLRPLYDEWQAFVRERNRNAPPGMKNLFQTSSRWPVMRTEEVLLDSALAGVFISTALALVIILVSTLNLIITLFSIIVIVCIVCTFLGFMVVAGWSLAIIESISITILVGLSVDYVVHLANSINESSLVGRFERVRAGLTEIGISVFSASITTMGSAIFLLLTIITFFSKFGIFIVVTIFSSTIYSFGFFISLMFILGPRDKRVGNVIEIYKKIRAKVRKEEQC